MNKSIFYLTLKSIYCSIFIFVFFISSHINNSFAGEYEDYDTRQYSYNIFTASSWDLSPYVFAGYSFGWFPYVNNGNVEYGNMLRNGHNGFILGAGVTVNRNWSFGLSFQRLVKTSNLRGAYAAEYSEIDGIKSEVLLTNIDMSLRLPISYKNVDIHAVTGLNIISTNIDNKYYDGVSMVHRNIVSSLHKVGFGANIGVALSYRIFSGIYFKIECRRLFVITKNLLRDSWILNTGLGINF